MVTTVGNRRHGDQVSAPVVARYRGARPGMRPWTRSYGWLWSNALHDAMVGGTVNWCSNVHLCAPGVPVCCPGATVRSYDWPLQAFSRRSCGGIEQAVQLAGAEVEFLRGDLAPVRPEESAFVHESRPPGHIRRLRPVAWQC